MEVFLSSDMYNKDRSSMEMSLTPDDPTTWRPKRGELKIVRVVLNLGVIRLHVQCNMQTLMTWHKTIGLRTP